MYTLKTEHRLSPAGRNASSTSQAARVTKTLDGVNIRPAKRPQLMGPVRDIRGALSLQPRKAEVGEIATEREAARVRTKATAELALKRATADNCELKEAATIPGTGGGAINGDSKRGFSQGESIVIMENFEPELTSSCFEVSSRRDDASSVLQLNEAAE